MKGKTRLIWLAAFAAAIGLSLGGCGPMMDNRATPTSVSISGVPRVGEVFTASSSGRGFSDDHGYEWFRSGSPTGWGTGIGFGPELVITPSLVGAYVFARRFSASAGEGGAFRESNRIGPILPEN